MRIAIRAIPQGKRIIIELRGGQVFCTQLGQLVHGRSMCVSRGDQVAYHIFGSKRAISRFLAKGRVRRLITTNDMMQFIEPCDRIGRPPRGA